MLNPLGLEAKRETSHKIWPARLVIHLRTKQYNRVVQTSKSPVSQLIFRLHPQSSQPPVVRIFVLSVTTLILQVLDFQPAPFVKAKL